ncbi:MAG: hypothetical protein JXA18_04330 [Chitinispirillaceae bacterium]|nr:hypothetical protein [Chitinispirillaceae bacterium]
MIPAGRFSSDFILKSVTVVVTAGIFFFCQSADSRKSTAGVKPTLRKTAAAEASAAPPAGEKSAPAVEAPQQRQQKLIVYYFHGSMRCPTCHKLENYAKSEIEASFSDAIKTGQLEWKTINVEEGGNEHFVDKYKLYTKSVIVSTVKDGGELSWKNLDKIWQLVHNEGKYRKYIRDEVQACLEGKCL